MRNLVLRRLVAKNFLQYRKADVVIPERGLIHIAGRNGAGKSALFAELPYWVFFEKTIRGIRADGVIRERSKTKEVSGIVYMTFDGKRYKVERRRGGVEGRQLFVNGKLAPHDWFERTTGVTEFTFANSFLFSANVYGFPGLPPQQQAKVIEGLFRLSHYDKARTNAEAKVKELRYSLLEADQAVARHEREIKTLKTELRDLRSEQGKRARAQAKEDKAREAEADKARRRLTDARKAARRARMYAVRFKRHRAAARGLYRVAQDSLHDSRKLYAEQRDGWHRMEWERDSCKAKIDKLSFAKGECDRCGQTITKAHVKKQQAALAVEAEKYDKEHKKRAKSVALSKTAVQKYEEAARKIEKSGQRLTSYLERARARFDRATDKIRQARRDLARLTKAAKPKADPYAYQIEKTEAKLKEERAKLADQRKRQNRHSISLNHYSVSAELFQKMRLWKLRGVTDEINEALDEAMGILTEGQMAVRLRTVHELKSGELREKYSLELENTRGGSSYKASSVGEQSRIKLAFMMAFSKVASALAQVSCNVTVLDEIVGGLDKQGVGAVMDVLRRFSRDRSILFLSADESVKAFAVDERFNVSKDARGNSRVTT